MNTISQGMVSVIIPTYNAEATIKQAVESSLSQNQGNIEVLVIDDGSTDETYSEMRSYDNDPRVKYLKISNSGASEARNIGLRMSRGSWIQYLDADDKLLSGKIEYQINACGDVDTKVLCIGSYYELFKDSDNLRGPHYHPCDKRPIDWLSRYCYGDHSNPPSVYLLNRKLIDYIGYWQTVLSYNDDTEYFAKALMSADIIVNVPESSSIYRRGNAQSLGSRRDKTSIESEYLSYRYIESMMYAYDSTATTREAIATLYARYIFRLYPKYGILRAMAESRISELSVRPNRNYYKKRSAAISKFIGWRLLKVLKTTYFYLAGTRSAIVHNK